MKIIILGYSSFTGKAISSYFSSMDGVELVYVGRKDSGLCNVIKFEVASDAELVDSDVADLITRLNLDDESILINCISMGDVDRSEIDKNSCKIQNYQFVATLYNHLKNTNFKKLIHLSTSMVYDGNNAPYDENSNCAPVNFYGATKLKADEFLLSQEDSRVMVVRPITMYGKVESEDRINPVSMIIKNLKNHQSLKLVDDILVNILYVGDLVKAIEKLIEINFSGLINISGDKVYSRYSLGIEIANFLGVSEDLIESTTLTEFKTVADRPLDTSFDNTLMKRSGIHPQTLTQVIPSLL